MKNIVRRMNAYVEVVDAMKFIGKYIFFILIFFLLTQPAASEGVTATAQFQLTSGGVRECDATWSPDDERIAYISEGMYGSELWVMDLKTSNKVRYIQSTDWLGQPNWGKDGILYTSQYSFKRDRHWDIWFVDSEGLYSKQLTYNKTDQQSPLWSNNSSSILFMGRNNYDYEIWTLDMNTSLFNRLTYFQEEIEALAWNPYNTKVAFSKKEGDARNLWLMNMDGTGLVQLTKDKYNQTQPDWSPDGRWIAYVSDETGNYDIWVIKPDGSGKEILINESRDQYDPDWSHDGTGLLYTSYEDRYGNGDIWAASIHIEPPPAPTPSLLPTQNVIDTETKENISRLTILGALFVILIIGIVVLRKIRSSKSRY